MEWRFWARTRPVHFDAFGDDCDAIAPLLSLYGDGMASPAEARLVEAHLPGCESCRESLAWMQATRRALTGRPVQSPPTDLYARIAEAIATSEAAPLRLRPARIFVTRPAFAAAASLAAVGLLLGYSLTHLPPPGATVNTGPAHSVATVPGPASTVTAAPGKHAAPSVKKTQPAPQMADKNMDNDADTGSDAVPNDTSPVVAPDAAPAPKLSQPSARPEIKPAVKAAPPVAELRPHTAPHLKLAAPHPTSLVATNSPAMVKHTLAPQLTKAPVAVASADTKGTVKSPDVQVLPPKVTVEPSAPEQTASVTPAEPHVQSVDFIHELSAHLPATETHFSRTVGLSLRGAAAATRSFGSDRTPGIAITQGSFGP